MRVPAREILIPPKEDTTPLFTFWQRVIRTRKMNEEDEPFQNVRFQYFMYMSWCYTRMQRSATPRPMKLDNEDDDDDEHEQDVGGEKWTSVKFQQFYRMLENIFFTEGYRESLQTVFCKSQRTYHVMTRFARRWKMRHVPSTIEHDLNLAPIDRSKMHLYMTLYHNNAVYWFRISELLHMMETALCHCVNFFVDPQPPKNPYTNQPFSKAMLLSIYDRIRHSDYRMPILFELFYRVFFNMSKFTHEHEAIIRDRYIERMVKYGDVEVLSYHIRKMLRYFHVFRHMDPQFPKSQLIHIFRPYVGLYLTHFFSTVYSEKKEMAYVTLHRHLHKLMSYNPRLGQKIMMKRNIFDCPMNVEKIKDKYLALMTRSSTANDSSNPFSAAEVSSSSSATIEVFCIDHLPYHTIVKCSSASIAAFQPIFNERDEDQEDTDENEEEEEDDDEF